VRLAGTNAPLAAKMLEESDMDFVVGEGLKSAAENVVTAIN
jgi:succinyl-CoA synthetase beta subunit